eukprot:06539.XXX_40343_40453_1 [CDS] Oithona nana genome sequencing.
MLKLPKQLEIPVSSARASKGNNSAAYDHVMGLIPNW